MDHVEQSSFFRGFDPAININMSDNLIIFRWYLRFVRNMFGALRWWLSQFCVTDDRWKNDGRR